MTTHRKFMRRLLFAFTSGFLLVGSTLAFAQQGYVHDVNGDVQAVVGTGKPVKVEKNQNLLNNTVISTGPKSNVVLKFVDGTVIALNENTSFQIQKYDYNEKSPSTMTALFSMLKGGMRAVTGAISSRNREGFKVATPNATIGIRGTEFMAQLVNPLFVQVISGTVSLTNAAGVGLVAAGQAASVASATTLATTIPAVPAGTFGTLPGLPVPPAIPAPVPVPAAAGAGSAAAGAAAGGVTGGLAVGAAAAAAAVAASVAGSENNATGTSGTTGTTGTVP